MFIVCYKLSGKMLPRSVGIWVLLQLKKASILVILIIWVWLTISATASSFSFRISAYMSIYLTTVARMYRIILKLWWLLLVMLLIISRGLKAASPVKWGRKGRTYPLDCFRFCVGRSDMCKKTAKKTYYQAKVWWHVSVGQKSLSGVFSMQLFSFSIGVALW